MTDAADNTLRPSPLNRPGVRIALIIAVIVIAIAAVVGLFHYWTVGRYEESTNDAYIQADAVVIAPKISGYVDQVYVIDNQAVKPGDPLFRIDARDYKSRVAEAQAQIDAARADAQSLKAQIAEQQAAVASAMGQLASAQSDLTLATDIEKRYKSLAATGAESRETYAEKRNQLARAQAAVATRTADVDTARRRVGSLQAQIAQATARAEGGEAQRVTANVNLGSTIVRATTAGRVGNKTVEMGQFVQPGTRVMSVVPVQKLYVEANFKETQLGMMRVGQPVTIEVDALGGVELHGKVQSFAPGTGAQFSLLPPENATGNFTKIVQRVPVRISIDARANTLALLLPGMSVTTTVNTKSGKASLDKVADEQEPN
ncbi:MAG: HlyD family secretion protein [Novosphingobium sp.]|nr:HlyD family secretion protein [Novosphingobium sp.]